MSTVYDMLNNFIEALANALNSFVKWIKGEQEPEKTTIEAEARKLLESSKDKYKTEMNKFREALKEMTQKQEQQDEQMCEKLKKDAAKFLNAMERSAKEFERAMKEDPGPSTTKK